MIYRYGRNIKIDLTSGKTGEFVFDTEEDCENVYNEILCVDTRYASTDKKVVQIS